MATASCLVLAALLLAGGNLWYAAERSTIPLSLDEMIVQKETRREKHPGRDDVHFLHFESGWKRHVDADVFQAVAEGERIRKAAWSRELQHGSEQMPLVWSADFQGMRLCMPWIVAVVIATLIRGFRLRHRS